MAFNKTVRGGHGTCKYFLPSIAIAIPQIKIV